MSATSYERPTQLVHIDDIINLYATVGGERYDESISQIDHALQCAALARRDGEPDQLVVAALLHDIGHLLYMRATGERDAPDVDTHHEVTGADALAQLFGDAVLDPIRGHVMAKKVLLATDPEYAARLSPGSAASAVRQGGAATEREVATFLAQPGADEALRLRRIDDAGKIDGLEVGSFDDYRPVLEALSR